MNADLIGVVSPEGDAELVALAATFLQAVDLQPNDVQILVNNRRLVESDSAGTGDHGRSAPGRLAPDRPPRQTLR